MERKKVLARTLEAFGGRRSVHDSLILPQHNHVELKHSDILRHYKSPKKDYPVHGNFKTLAILPVGSS